MQATATDSPHPPTAPLPASRLPLARAVARRIGPTLGLGLLFLIVPLLLLTPNVLLGQTLVPYDVLAADPVFRATLEAAGVGEPDNALLADLVYQNDVWKRFAVDSLQSGVVPLWNPWLFGGVPFLAAGQHGMLYPQSVVFLLLPVETAFGWNALLTLWLAGITAYWLGRALRLGRFAAALMGITWSASLILVTNVVFPMIQGVLVWTPLVLAAIDVVAQSAEAGRTRGLLPHGRSVGWLAVLAVATALAALSGHVEMLYYAGLLAGAFTAFRMTQVARGASAADAARATAWLVGAAGLGVLLAAVQLVPLAELARTSWRSGAEAYATVVGYGFGPRQLVTFLVPDAYGNPADHAVWDLVRGARVALEDHAMWGTAWGTKNYVEAAAYIGVLPLVLAVAGALGAARRGLAWFMAAAAAVSLSFAFGLPTYRLLFLGLPGFDQLHTPFRWVFPFALCTVVLAGLGADRLARGRAPRGMVFLGNVVLLAGIALATAVALAIADPVRWTALFERWLSRAGGAADAALAHFPSTSAFASYELWNLLHLAVSLILSGAVVLWLARAGAPTRTRRWAQALALVVAGADLAIVGFQFNPSVDPSLAEVRPPAVEWLADAARAKWGRVVGFGDAKVLWPNTAMRAPVADVRGYDSLIPRWVVETYNAIDTGATDLDPASERHDMLAYNRFGNLREADRLAHPGLAALGGRYVVTTEAPEADHLELLYDEDVRIYENTLARPRAWVVSAVEVIAERDRLLASLAELDPATTVLLEETPDLGVWHSLPAGRPVPRPVTRVRKDTETANQIEIDVIGAPSGGMLVVADTWFPGWQATVQPVGEETETAVPVYRANGSMRAIPVPNGPSLVRLRYSPMSIKIGLYASFLAAVVLLLLVAYALWDRFVRVNRDDQLGLVAVNSAGPMAASLVNKAVDFVFAMLMLRVLGSENAGNFYYAVAVIGFAEIFTNFGLNLLTTREVARDPDRASWYLSSTTTVRLLLWLAMVPLLAGYLALERATGAPVGGETALAVALLAVSLVPGSLNTALSSVFQGLERMMVPAGVSIVATLAKVSLGALVLLAGFGFVGLAAVSIVTNLVTLAVLGGLAWRLGLRPTAPGRPAALWAMAVVSLPFMLNHLLMTLFFRIDVVILRRIQGAVVVGWYSTAYKWVDALLIIPPAVTMALFPLLSRHATEDRAALRRTYVIALRWLITLALPIAAATTFASELLVGILGGPEYLPHGAIALSIMIWFLPFSFANGLTQYVLIALDRQRWITVSFVIAATFNIVANILVIPQFSYSGAAAVTIASEIVLLVPFLWGLRDIGAPPILVLAWRPAIATSLMAMAMALLESLGANVWVGVPVGLAVFAAALVRLGGVTAEDRALLARLRRGPRTGPAAVDPSPTG